jgi:hypothetical protein
MVKDALDEGHPDSYRFNWDRNLIVDDVLWTQSIIANRHLWRVRQKRQLTTDEMFLGRCIQMGTTDMDARDKPNDASTRAMRFASVMGDRLWGLLEVERTRVGSPQFVA